jgi:NAD(P)-dependent dehydrogenase (short-subunit alcohol dehydrogenase family)
MHDTINKLFNLKGKVAIVTGAAGLLGQQFVSVLRKAGANVVAIDIVDDIVGKIVNEDYPGVDAESAFFKLNICDKEGVKAMVNKVLNKWNKIDILINSAAIDPKFDKENINKNEHTFEDYPIDEWQKSLNVNLTGTFIITQQVGKIMSRQLNGNIINIASTYGMVGPDQRIYKKSNELEQASYKPISYAVTKGATLQFTRYLAAYWQGKNIRVNSLTPGGVENNQEDEFLTNYSYRTPTGRMAKIDELNGALLFLSSDASSYMNGANLVIDGGWTSW